MPYFKPIFGYLLFYTYLFNMFELSLTASTVIVGAFFIAHWYTSLFMQSFFHHRYAAHMQFTTGKFWEKVFYIFSYITQGSSYLSPRTYGIMHRIHHAHTDTEKDPHSPKFMPRLYKMMWETKKYYRGIYSGQATVEGKYLKNLPDWKFLDWLGHSWGSRIFWVAAYITFYAFFATQWWMYLILPIHVVMGPFHGAIINWFAHKVGYINYPMSNTSTNLINFDFLMWGESLHNNHHKHPGRANFATRWFELDPMYPIIRVMNWLGIIKLANSPRLAMA